MPIGKLVKNAQAWLETHAPGGTDASSSKPPPPAQKVDPRKVDAFEALPIDQRLKALRLLGAAERSALLEQIDPTVRAETIGGGDPKKLADVWYHDVGPEMEYDWSTFDFDPPGGFSVNNARGLAVMSKRAYEDFGEDGSDPAKVGAGFEDFARQGFELRFFGRGNGSTQAFLAIKDDQAILVFRGTTMTRIEDICADANAFFTDGYGGRVHSGFDNAVDEVWPDITATLQSLQKERGTMKLHVTGHSLGGALATVAAARLAETPGVELKSVVPLASPRVFDDAAAQAYDKVLGDKTYRFVNNTDTVTQVPPEKLGYAHVGKMLYFDSYGRLRDNPSEKQIEADREIALLDPHEIAKAFHRAKPWQPAVVEGLWDHGPVGYCRHFFVNPQIQRYNADEVASAVERYLTSVPAHHTASKELLQGLTPAERDQALALLTEKTRAAALELLGG